MARSGPGSGGGTMEELPFRLVGTPASGNRHSPVIDSLRRQRRLWPIMQSTRLWKVVGVAGAEQQAGSGLAESESSGR